jgi:ferritin-like metal-binding protein YciE
MTIDSIDALLHEELKDIYDAEKQLVKALPKMAKAATSEELRSAFQEHLEVTKGQVARLEQVFDLIGEKAKGKPCAGMKGLLEEGQEAMKEDAEEPFKDAAMISAAQRVEHYEISAYGSARALAEIMGSQEVVDLLQQTLEEEEEADHKLTEICKTLLEDHASMEEEEDEDIQEVGEEDSMPSRSAGRRAMPDPKVRRAG